jgi:MipA family protein
VKRVAGLVAILAGIAAAPALGQDDEAASGDPSASVETAPRATPAEAETVFDGDWLAVGAGAGYSASYDGSDDYLLYPVPVVAGSLGGIGISPRAGGLALDLLDGVEQGRISFSFGPAGRLRGNRASQIEDPVVRAAGKLDEAIEIGPTAGITLNRVLNDYDWVSVGIDVRWDVAGAHRGMVVDPGVSYFTPLSRGLVLGLSAGATWVDDDYADYYYSVSPAQSAASGLPLYAARSGWHMAGLNTALGFDLDGDFTNGGFAVGVSGGYSRMLGDAKRTPYTAIRGDADQWLALAGIGYVF